MYPKSNGMRPPHNRLVIERETTWNQQSTTEHENVAGARFDEKNVPPLDKGDFRGVGCHPGVPKPVSQPPEGVTTTVVFTAAVVLSSFPLWKGGFS
jgi:hypothetical protein